MNYPMKEVYDVFGGSAYREMTPLEYEATLDRYRDIIEQDKDSTSRRVQEYVDYLRRWFGDGKCDGWDSFEKRYTMHQLPMSYNIYFN